MLAGLLLPTIVAFASGFFDLIFSLLLCARVGPALDMGKPAEQGLWVSGLFPDSTSSIRILRFWIQVLHPTYLRGVSMILKK